MNTTAVYVRVSSSGQSMASQVPELERWADREGGGVEWFRDTATGRSMERPGWRRLEEGMRAGQFTRVVVWRLDRLGRTAAGLAQLFEELRSRNVELVSLRDGFTLGTASGRLFAHLLASIAVFETEVRGERQAAGIAAAKAAGRSWGGRAAGSRNRKTAEREAAVRRLAGEMPVAEIARALGLSRGTVYRLMAG